MKQLFTLSLLIIGLSTQAQPYCTPNFTGCAFNNYISNVNVGGINNTTTGCTMWNYTAMLGNLTVANPNPMSITVAGWDGVAVFVDLNNDGDLSDPNELLYNHYQALSPPITYNFTISIPPGTLSGNHRMRVMCGNGGSVSGSPDPCNGVQYGNYHDYTVYIPASGANDVGVSSVGPPAAFCPGIQNIDATIGNFGINQVSSFTVNWTLGGILQTPHMVTASLDTAGGSGSLDTTITLGSNNFVLGNTYDIIAWTSIPNGVADTVPNNDSSLNSLTVTVPGVTAINSSNILDISADISWTELATASQWEIEWGPQGFVLGTGSSLIASTNPISLTGLVANTNYCVYVRSICGPGDTSTWAGPECFLTTCGLFSSPMFEDFDGAQWTGPGVGTIDQCWYRNHTTVPYWQVDNNGTSSIGTGPSADVSGTGKYLYLETSGGAAGDSSIIESPWIDLGSATAPQVVFYYHMYGATMGTLKVQASSDGTNWTNMFSISGQQQAADTDPFIKATVPLIGFANDTIKVRFVGIRSTSFTSDMAIDEVKVRQAPQNDLQTSQITGIATGCGLGNNESFNVTVINQGAADQDTFDIEYKLNSGNWIVGTTVTTPLLSGSTGNYAVNGVDLSAAGNYCIEAKAVLSNDEDSTNDVTNPECLQNLLQPMVDSIQEDELCELGTLNLGVTISNATSIEWYDDPALTNLVNTGASHSVPGASSTQTFYILGLNTNGCSTVPATVVGTVSNEANVDFTYTVTGSNVDFTSAIIGGNDSVFWDFGDQSSSNSLNPTHLYANTGTFLVLHTAYTGSCISDTSKALFVSVGLEDSEFSKSIQVFPNPSDGLFSLSIPNGEGEFELEVIGLDGTRVHQDEYSAKGKQDKIGLDLRALKSGTYFLKVISGEKVAVKRLSIQ